MNKLLWWDNKRPAQSVWIENSDAAPDIAKAMRSAGWNVVWTVHYANSVRPQPGYEKALQDWQDSMP